MKKLLLVAMFAGSFVFVNAQNNASQSKWVLTAGPVVSIPAKFLGMFHSFGVGADVAAIRGINDGWSAGARANYLYFFGKSVDNNIYGNTIGSHYNGTHLFNILGDVNYSFPSKIMIGVDLGLGLGITGGASDANFARMIYVGYQAGQSRPLIFSVYFEQTDYYKNVGLRAAFPI